MAGEKFGKRLSSGLVIASNFPIMESFSKAFNQWECAGFDCLANKGVAMARIEIPGVPDKLEIVTTHHNSKSASGVSLERTLEAHKLQVLTTGEFLAETANFELPAIWGGDLNMRHSDERIDNFIKRAGDDLNEVSSYCIENPAAAMSKWTGRQTRPGMTHKTCRAGHRGNGSTSNPFGSDRCSTNRSMVRYLPITMVCWWFVVLAGKTSHRDIS